MGRIQPTFIVVLIHLLSTIDFPWAVLLGDIIFVFLFTFTSMMPLDFFLATFPAAGGLSPQKVVIGSGKSTSKIPWENSGLGITLPETSIAHENPHLSW